MRHLLFITLTFLTVQLCAQRSGTIKYTETRKLDLKGIEGLNIEGMPNELSSNMHLSFDSKTSVYKTSKDNESEEINMENEEGTFQIKFSMDENEDILHTDLSTQETVFRTDFMGKDFLISNKKEKLKWKITDERIKYLGYVCQKATATKIKKNITIKDNEEQTKEQEIVAWFTPEIPVAIGPEGYSGLPGAILMVSVDDGDKEYKATEVILEEVDATNLEKPKKGKKVTQEEYEKIVKEKMAEMQKQYGGKGTVIIGG